MHGLSILNKLSQTDLFFRTYNCSECGIVLNRDINTNKNLRRLHPRNYKRGKLKASHPYIRNQKRTWRL